jgi:DinB superfamily
MPRKKKMAVVTGALFATCYLTALAQESAPTQSFVAEAKNDYADVKNNLLKASDRMPEEGYSFQATSSVRTFGALVAHVTEVQSWVCGALLGSASKPAEPGKTKAELVAALKASFATCDFAYDSVTTANQSQIAGNGFLKRSRLAVLFLNNEHDNETYGTISLYLRLKGIVPPSSEGSQ